MHNASPSSAPSSSSSALHTPKLKCWSAARYLQRELHMYAKPFKCESQTQSCFNFLGAYWLSRGQYTQFSYFSINIQQGILYCDCGECGCGSVTGTCIHMTLLLFTEHVCRNIIQKYAHIHSQDGLSDVLQPTFSQKTGLTSAVCPAVRWSGFSAC